VAHGLGKHKQLPWLGAVLDVCCRWNCDTRPRCKSASACGGSNIDHDVIAV